MWIIINHFSFYLIFNVDYWASAITHKLVVKLGGPSEMDAILRTQEQVSRKSAYLNSETKLVINQM